MTENDHDLLITVSADVKHLVQELKEMKTTIGGFAKDLPVVTDKVNAQLKDKVSWTQLWGIVVLLAGIIGATFTYNFADDASAHAIARKNETKIYMLHDKGVSNHVDSDIRVDK
jgi:hypothetical protein